MGISFTIGTRNFLTLAGRTAGRYALDEITPAENFDVISYHVKGVDGKYRTLNGLIDADLSFKIRYISANPYADMVADRELWKNNPLQIVSYAGDTWKRCLLKAKGLRPLGPSKAIANPGGAALHFLDCIAEFDSAQLVNT